MLLNTQSGQSYSQNKVPYLTERHFTKQLQSTEKKSIDKEDVSCIQNLKRGGHYVMLWKVCSEDYVWHDTEFLEGDQHYSAVFPISNKIH
jgi:hypothetical protein